MFDLRYLFAGICIYYSVRRYTNALYQLYFRLKKEQITLMKDFLMSDQTNQYNRS